LVFVLVRKVYFIQRFAGLVKVDFDAKASSIIVLEAAIGLVEFNGLLEMFRVFGL